VRVAIAGYDYKTLNRAIGRAIHDYDMIRDGDRIPGGIIGRLRQPDDAVDAGRTPQTRPRRLPAVCRLHRSRFSAPLPMPCSLSASAWRSRCVPNSPTTVSSATARPTGKTRVSSALTCAVNAVPNCAELGCSTLALGHNKDDVIETLFLNICYSGEISTMRPAQDLFNGRFKVIRPMAYADEQLVRRCARNWRLPVIANPCPSAGNSRRASIKDLLQQLYRSNRKIKGNIFHAMRHVKPEYLLK